MRETKSLNTGLFRAGLQDFRPFKIMLLDTDRSHCQAFAETLQRLPHCEFALDVIQANSIEQAKQILRTERGIAIALLVLPSNYPSDYIELVHYLRKTLKIELTRTICLLSAQGEMPEEQVRIEFDIDDCWSQKDLTPNHLSTLISSSLRTWTQLRALKRSKVGLENIIAASKIIAQQPDLESFAQTTLEQAQQLNAKVQSGFAAFIDTENHPYSLDLSIISGIGEYQSLIDCKLSQLPNQQAREICLRSLISQKNISNGQHIVLMFQTEVLEHRQLFLVYFYCSKSLETYESDLLWFFSESLASSFQNLRLVSRTSRLAYRDYSIGAYNRTWLLKKLNQTPAADRVDKVLLVFEINNFAEMNITFGEDFCQVIVQKIYKNLLQALGEKADVSHPAVDEFAVIIPEQQASPAFIEQFCAQTITLGGTGHSVPLTASIVPLNEIDNMSPGQLLGLGESLVDLNRKHNQAFRVFDHSISQAVSDRYSLLHRLRLAILNGDIHIALQPKVELASGKLIGFEALARWRTAEGQDISPTEFIPVAETAGMIQQLGLYMLEQTFTAVRAMNALGVYLPVAFNVSASQLLHQDCFDQLVDKITESGLDFSQLEMEITESEYIEDYQTIQSRLKTLADIGIDVSIDDFGTGYSSLSHVYQLSAKTIKIDRVFIERLDNTKTGAAIVDVVVRLGNNCGYQVLAEGIETEAQRQQLLSLGCVYGQGFLFAPPMSLPTLQNWLLDRRDINLSSRAASSAATGAKQTQGCVT